MATNYMFIFLLVLVAFVSSSLSFEQKRKSLNPFKRPSKDPFMPVLGDHKTNPNGFLNILVIGDWGRKGRYNQTVIAYKMGVIGKKLDIDFVISTGDNFYDDGLTGVEDPAFKEPFTSIYTSKILQKPWYAVLGDHDYHLNSAAQVSPKLKEIEGRWNCKRNFVVKAGVADFVFIDTTPFVDAYFKKSSPSENNFNWTDIQPRQPYLKKIRKELGIVLKNSTAHWKIVVGHHPIKSIGFHGDTIELTKTILPILKKNNVDMYINGHDHSLQQIGSKKGFKFLTSGAGSKAYEGSKHYLVHKDEVEFFHDGQGFMSAQYGYSNASIVFYDIFGKTLHTLVLHKNFEEKKPKCITMCGGV